MWMRLVNQPVRWLPELGEMGAGRQTAVVRQWLLFVWLLPVALLTLVWLGWASVPLVWVGGGLLVGVLFRYLFSRLNFSSILAADAPMLQGAQGRFISWALLFLYGPVVLWADVLIALLDAGRGWRHCRGRMVWQRQQQAVLLNGVLLALVRDVLPGLVGGGVSGRRGGRIPLVAVADGEAMMGATAVHLGLFLLLMFLVFVTTLYGANYSRLFIARLFVRMGLTLLLLFVLPELLAVLAIWLYILDGSAMIAIALLALLTVGGLAHYLNQRVEHNRRQAHELYQLEQMAQALLREPMDALDLGGLCSQFLPRLYGDAWMEIRLLTGEVLYFQGDGWLPGADALWQQLDSAGRDYLMAPALPEAVGVGYGRTGILVPILAERQEGILGGIYLLGRPGLDMRGWLPVTQALAGQIAAALLRVDSYHEALEAQAKAFEEEVYAQAYQAEVYAQVLAYERMAQELALAGKIQASFLPQDVPHLPGWQVAVALEPARETSGDFYDFIPLENGRLGILIADVADKGMGAALYMALSRTLIRIFAAEFQDAPARVLQAANRRILADTNSDLFVTVFYGVLDATTGQFVYCNAGHNPPYVQSANGNGALPLTRTALPLGILEDTAWEQAAVLLQRGEALVLYTDGLTEAEDEEAAYFGEQRLLAVVQGAVGRSADVMEDKIMTAVFDFMGDAPQHDDMTLVVVMRDA
jgi:serine phosphatase RsbU (regulator of sigma subunit)